MYTSCITIKLSNIEKLARRFNKLIPLEKMFKKHRLFLYTNIRLLIAIQSVLIRINKKTVLYVIYQAAIF